MTVISEDFGVADGYNRKTDAELQHQNKGHIECVVCFGSCSLRRRAQKERKLELSALRVGELG